MAAADRSVGEVSVWGVAADPEADHCRTSRSVLVLDGGPSCLRLDRGRLDGPGFIFSLAVQIRWSASVVQHTMAAGARRTQGVSENSPRTSGAGRCGV